MKFGKSLQNQIDATAVEWQDKFLSYKRLKKRLKSIKAQIRFREAAFASSFRRQQEVSDVERGGRGGGVGTRNVTSASPMLLEIASRTTEDSETSTASTGADRIEDAAVGCVEVVALKRVREVEGEGWALSTGLMNMGASAEKKRAVGEGLRETSQLIGVRAMESGPLSVEDSEFVRLLNVELDKFNRFFVEKEEEFVIRLQELKERIQRVKETRGDMCAFPDSLKDEEFLRIRKDIVTFHGEMVLLENYSSLNYTGLVKIVKKHDKTTNGVLRLPYIQSVLHQPFFTTELLSKLVRECETILLAILAPAAVIDGSEFGAEEINGRTDAVQDSSEETVQRGTRAALRTIEDIRKPSSTYSVLSIPLFKRREKGEDGCVIALDEQLTHVA